MKRICISVFLIILSVTLLASPNTDSLTKALNQAIKDAPTYDNSKLLEIEGLIKSLNETSSTDLSTQYNLNYNLYKEYEYYNYDSAMHYAKQLQQLSVKSNNVSLLVDARLKVVFVTLTGGMFKETFEALDKISVTGVADSVKAEYFTLTSLANFNLADFNNDGFNNNKATIYLDSALALWPPASFNAFYFSAIKFLKKGKPDSALTNLFKLIDFKNLTTHQLALVTSTIGGIYISKNQEKNAIPYLIRASIADIKSSTKETLALLTLAGLVYKDGNIDDAVKYIEKANADATQYNARLRKVQVGNILPLIEGKMVDTIKAQKQKLVFFLVLLAGLALLLAAFAFVIRSQVKRLKIARKSLYEANLNQQLINKELVSANHLKEELNQKLHQINLQLSETNKIKEEYIGYFFSSDTEFLNRLEKIITAIDKKMIERKYGEINGLLHGIDTKREKEALLKNFDRVFIKLFPDFVVKFNSLFNEAERIELKDGQLLNTELRIFALIRLGITDNEKIAEILGYSINTIYAKKTKVRGRTNINKDEFEKRLFEITTLKTE